MAEPIRDAIRHLEKDMADIMEMLTNKDVTEVILNPYRKPDGTYEGHILVDKHGVGIHNLTRNTELKQEPEVLSINDVVVYKYNITEPDNILFWVKIPKYTVDFSVISDVNVRPILNKIASILKNYFSVINGIEVIVQTSDFNIIELAENLEDGMINFLENTNSINDYLKQIITIINLKMSRVSSVKFEYKILENQSDINLFKEYPLKLIKTDFVKMTATKAETIMSVLASITGKFIHAKSPRLECQIPKYGHRFTGVIPPASNYPAFCIRRHSSKIYTLDDFVNHGILQETSRDTILSWIQRKYNILIAGGTGSGKTTLANAILYEISKSFPDSRMLIIEDVPELQFNTSRSISLTIGESFSLYDALRTTLRFKPERIIMGEVRGAEAYTLLKAWNTGHPGGVATIHANGVNEALYRFESCIRDNPEAKVNRQEIGFTINGIIAIQNITVKEEGINGEYVNNVKRKVTALRQIIQYDSEKDIYQDVVYDRLEETFDTHCL